MKSPCIHYLQPLGPSFPKGNNQDIMPHELCRGFSFTEQGHQGEWFIAPRGTHPVHHWLQCETHAGGNDLLTRQQNKAEISQNVVLPIDWPPCVAMICDGIGMH